MKARRNEDWRRWLSQYQTQIDRFNAENADELAFCGEQLTKYSYHKNAPVLYIEDALQRDYRLNGVYSCKMNYFLSPFIAIDVVTYTRCPKVKPAALDTPPYTCCYEYESVFCILGKKACIETFSECGATGIKAYAGNLFRQGNGVDLFGFEHHGILFTDIPGFEYNDDFNAYMIKEKLPDDCPGRYIFQTVKGEGRSEAWFKGRIDALNTALKKRGTVQTDTEGNRFSEVGIINEITLIAPKISHDINGKYIVCNGVHFFERDHEINIKARESMFRIALALPGIAYNIKKDNVIINQHMMQDAEDLHKTGCFHHETDIGVYDTKNNRIRWFNANETGIFIVPRIWRYNGNNETALRGLSATFSVAHLWKHETINDALCNIDYFVVQKVNNGSIDRITLINEIKNRIIGQSYINDEDLSRIFTLSNAPFKR